MTKIGGGGGPQNPGVKPEVEGAQPSNKTAGDGTEVSRAEGDGRGKVDSFQRAGIEAKLQGLSDSALMQRLNFSNEDLALLARTFSTIVRQNPNADRLERSKLFARAILKKKGTNKRGPIADLLDEDNETFDDDERRSLQELYDLIAAQLDSTPVFAQLVDEVTESARKMR